MNVIRMSAIMGVMHLKVCIKLLTTWSSFWGVVNDTNMNVSAMDVSSNDFTNVACWKSLQTTSKISNTAYLSCIIIQWYLANLQHNIDSIKLLRAFDLMIKL